jgi:hypothetical protein
MFSRLAESVGRVDNHQKNHSGEPKRFCVGKDHRTLQRHGEAPSFDRTEAILTGPRLEGPPRPIAGQSTTKEPEAPISRCPVPHVLAGLLSLDNDVRQAEESYRRVNDHWKRFFVSCPRLVPSRVREASDAVVRVVV